MITYVIYKIINYRYIYFSKICKKAFYFFLKKKKRACLLLYQEEESYTKTVERCQQSRLLGMRYVVQALGPYSQLGE